jgi:triphosphoribosyl-dephospho-CoA synthase
MTAAWALGERRADPSAALARFVPDGRAIAASAVQSLLLELATWPKPGLVSHVDRGSHDDMDTATFRASAAAIEPYFHALADAGARGCRMGRLRVIGLEAEAAGQAGRTATREELRPHSRRGNPRLAGTAK